MSLNLTTSTPAQIDTELAVIEQEIGRLVSKVALEVATIARIEKIPADRRMHHEKSMLDRAVQAKAEHQTTIAAKTAEAAPLHAEYTRRGGWSRYFLVTNTGGHVHNTMACSTCYPTTQYAWLPEQSGMSGTDLIALAGEKVCTVCFPDAPVSALALPSQIELPEVKAKRVEREQARDARDAAAKAKSITMPDGSPVLDAYGSPFKTERAATNARTAAIKDLAWYQKHPDAQTWVEVVRDVNIAVAAKHGRSVEDEHADAMKKATAAFRRECGRPMPTPPGL